MRPLPAIPSPISGPPPSVGMLPPPAFPFPGFPQPDVRPDFGSSGIESLLQPLLTHINTGYKQDVVQPYVQQVEELTTSTFPNVNFNGIGSLMPRPMPQPRPGGGGSLLELFRPPEFLAQTLR